MRLDLPFGAITVEFARNRSLCDVDLESLERRRVLPRALERPLAGFDFSQGDIYKPLLMATHWAANVIPNHVLEGIIGEAATAIPA